MADLNEVRLIGRLTRDPELRSVSTGQLICNFGFATGRKYKGSDGTLQEETTFIEVACWGKLAEVVNKYSKKGRQLFIAGRLKFDSWDDKQSGQKRSKLSVVAENVQFLDRKEDNGEINGSQELQPKKQDVVNYAPVTPVHAMGKNWNPQKTEWSEPELGEPPF